MKAAGSMSIFVLLCACGGTPETGSAPEAHVARRGSALDGAMCCHLVGPWHDVYKCVDVGSDDECSEACLNEEYEGSYCGAYFTTDEECSPSCGYVP
jgi:hypothetical protein